MFYFLQMFAFLQMCHVSGIINDALNWNTFSIVFEILKYPPPYFLMHDIIKYLVVLALINMTQFMIEVKEKDQIYRGNK